MNDIDTFWKCYIVLFSVVILIKIHFLTKSIQRNQRRWIAEPRFGPRTSKPVISLKTGNWYQRLWIKIKNYLNDPIRRL